MGTEMFEKFHCTNIKPSCIHMFRYRIPFQFYFSSYSVLIVRFVCQQKLGLNITDDQIKELEENVENVDFVKANEEEKLTRHDIMAHVHVFAAQCPLAAPIIHLGATSCDIADNTVMKFMQHAFLSPTYVKLLRKLDYLILSRFAGFTNYERRVGYFATENRQMYFSIKSIC